MRKILPKLKIAELIIELDCFFDIKCISAIFVPPAILADRCYRRPDERRKNGVTEDEKIRVIVFARQYAVTVFVF